MLRRFLYCVVVVSASSVVGCADGNVAVGPSTSFTLDQDHDSIFVGRAKTMIARLTRDGSIVTAGRFTWEVSDSSKARITEHGLVVALDTGRITVVAELDGAVVNTPLRIVLSYADGGIAMKEPATGTSAHCYVSTAASMYCASPETVDSIPVLQQVAGMSDVAAIAVGPDHHCALTTSFTQRCRGSNRFGQFMSGTTNMLGTWTTETVTNHMEFDALSAGLHFTCGIRRGDRRVVCMGSNSVGKTGKQPVEADTIIAAASFTQEVRQVAAGWGHTCVLDMLGSAFCWGFNQYGQLGVPRSTINTTFLPQEIPGGLTFDTLAASSSTCGITSANELHCWGNNVAGQLGLGKVDTLQHPTPERVPLSESVTSVHVGESANCAITASDALWCWGALPGMSTYWDVQRTNLGQPVQVVPSVRWKGVTVNPRGVCGLTVGARVICF